MRCFAERSGDKYERRLTDREAIARYAVLSDVSKSIL